LLAIVLFLGAVGGLAFNLLWQRHRRLQILNWGTAPAVVEAMYKEAADRLGMSRRVVLRYQYQVGGTLYHGACHISPQFWLSAPSESDLLGYEIRVRIDPVKPTRSAVVPKSIPGLNPSDLPEFFE
jgi:hypothetical protein